MKNVIVTGAAGFLGSHLMLHHLERGDNVLGLDNFCSSSPNSHHVMKIKSYPRALLNECDITVNGFAGLHGSIMDFGAMTKTGKIDLIYNFACPASPPIYQKIPIETLMACVQGTHNVLKYAKNLKCCTRVVHASTSEVYGDPDVSQQVESYRGSVNTWGDRANYDEGKRVAETLCYEYLKQGVDVRVVRIFNTYGPHMNPDDGRVVTNFVKQALADDDITIYGDGEQTRSFCYVDDLINAITRTADLPADVLTSPMNIGNPDEFTINELALEVIRLTGSKSRLVYKNLPMDDPKQRRPNITMARGIIKWEPKVNLTTGLEKMIEYMRNDEN